jgi:hypothetical protein
MVESRETPSVVQVLSNNTHSNKDLVLEATAQIRNGLPKNWHLMDTASSALPRYRDTAPNPKFIAQVVPSSEAALRTIKVARQIERALQRDTAQHIAFGQNFAHIEFIPPLAAHLNSVTDEAFLVYEGREGQNANPDSPEYTRIRALIPALTDYLDRWGVAATLRVEDFLVSTHPQTRAQSLHVIGTGNFSPIEYVSKKAVTAEREDPQPPRKAAKKAQTSRPAEAPRKQTNPTPPPLSEFTTGILEGVRAGMTYPQLQALAKELDPNLKKSRLSVALGRIRKIFPDLAVPSGEMKGRQMAPQISEILEAFKSGKSYAAVRAEFGFDVDDATRKEFTLIANRLRTSVAAKREGIHIPTRREKQQPPSA